MRRGSILPLMLLSLTAAGSAQAQVFHDSVHEPQTLVAKAHPDDLVARIMSFDRNSDGKVTKDELNERMQNLVALGDASGDGALDSIELRTVASAPQGQTAVRGFPHSGGYGFGDDAGFSSRLHIEGAIEDLRLAASTRDQALAVARTFADALEASSSATLLKELEPILTVEQLADFKRTLDNPAADIKISINPSGNGDEVRFLVARLQQQLALSRTQALLARVRLPAPQQQQALAAFERFKAQRRMGDAERSALLEQLSGVLGGAEREDLRAALERRPLVKGSGRIIVDGSVINRGGSTGGVVFEEFDLVVHSADATAR